MATEKGRRLTSANSYIAVEARQVHEFPSGTTCPNMGFSQAHPRLLAVDTSGPSISETTGHTNEVSLSSVSMKDFVPSEIQRFSAPLKLVHDSSCSAAPSLRLQLTTKVANLEIETALTVAGAALTPLAACGTGYHRDMQNLDSIYVAGSGANGNAGSMTISDCADVCTASAACRAFEFAATPGSSWRPCYTYTSDAVSLLGGTTIQQGTWISCIKYLV